MGPRRRLIAALAFVAVAAAGWLAVPRRFVVDGVSMGPALLPGDVVRTGPFPVLDRLRRPRRFERWVLAATDELAVKRIVGLPGERVAIVAGDLAIDGTVVLKGPRLLAETGSLVPDGPADALAAEAGWAWSRPAGEVLDDVAFDEGATRTLAAVRDVGLAVVVDVCDASAARPAEVCVRVGDTIVAWPFAAPGRNAVVAGRLDGRLVVAVWGVPPDAKAAAPRSCLPAAAPETWQTAEPWPEPGADGSAPALAVRGGDDRVTVAAVVRWRDVAWRPGADGRDSWTLGADGFLVLGDHPAASTDSRRWGPIKAAALRHPIVTRAPAW